MHLYNRFIVTRIEYDHPIKLLNIIKSNQFLDL